MKFSEKIVRLRKIKGITQDEFANAVGVSRQAVYKWECGQSYPEAMKLIEIKALFGISIDDLLDDTYEVMLPEKKKRKRISKVKVEKTEKVIDAEPALENPIREAVSEICADAVIEASLENEVAKTVTDEAEKIIEEVIAENTEDVSRPEVTPAPAVEEKQPEVKTEVKKRGFFSRIFGRR